MDKRAIENGQLRMDNEPKAPNEPNRPNKPNKPNKRKVPKFKEGESRELVASLLEPGVIEGYEVELRQQIDSGDYFDKPMREVEAHECLFMLTLAKELRGRDVSEVSTMSLVKMSELLQKTRDSRVRLREFIAGRADSRPEVTFREGAIEVLSDVELTRMIETFERQERRSK